MKVKCINIYNKFTDKFQNSSNILTIGREYIVLNVEISSGTGTINYRVETDLPSKMPALCSASQFEIVSNKICSIWRIHQYPSGSIRLCPESWTAPEFWENCYNRDPQALAIFRREKAIIFDEEK